MKKPAVSVCIPALNAERSIRATMESILAQDFTDFELVVLDNCSTDSTGDVVLSYGDPRIRLHRNNAVLPIAENWTKAASLAAADLVKMVPADDLIAPQCLSIQVEHLRDPAVAVTASRYNQIDDDGASLSSGLGLPNLLGRRTRAEALRVFVRERPDNITPSASVLFRRAQFERTSGFRTEYEYPMDIDLWARLCGANGDFLGDARPLATSRASTFNYSSTTSSLRKFGEIVKCNHATAREFPDLVRRRDVIIGDAKVFSEGLHRVWARAAGALRRDSDATTV